MFKKLYYLLGVSAIAVVITHANSQGFNALLAWTDRYQNILQANFDPIYNFSFILLQLSTQFFTFGVAAFFLVSGYFVSYISDQRNDAKQRTAIKNRILGLIIPYLVWTNITLITEALMGNTFPISENIASFVIGIPGYWFVPVLILFYLLSPFMVRIVKTNAKQVLIIFGMIQVVFLVMRYTVFEYIPSPFLYHLFYENFDKTIFNFLVYFPLGIVIGQYVDQAKQWINQKRKIFILFSIFFLVFSFCMNFFKHKVLPLNDDWASFCILIGTHFYNISFILLFLSLTFERFPFKSPILKIGYQTYGIFLAQFIFIRSFSVFVYHFFPTLLSQQLLFSFLVLILGLGGPLIFMWIIKQSSFKKVYPLLFG